LELLGASGEALGSASSWELWEALRSSLELWGVLGDLWGAQGSSGGNSAELWAALGKVLGKLGEGSAQLLRARGHSGICVLDCSQVF